MCFQIPQNLTKAYIESFRLQNLQPYTDYVVQMRCIQQENVGYWSDWSPNATARTPEARESLLNIFSCFRKTLDSQKKKKKNIYILNNKTNNDVKSYKLFTFG